MDRAREKETIITIMVGCMVLYAIFSHMVWWIAALAVGVSGMISDKLTRFIHIAWFWIAEKLGFITSKIILGVLFVAVLLPIALLARIFRRDMMLLKDNYPSYYVENPHIYEQKDLENPW